MPVSGTRTCVTIGAPARVRPSWTAHSVSPTTDSIRLFGVRSTDQTPAVSGVMGTGRTSSPGPGAAAT
ncbi:hypothetical protein D3C59_33545 [Streptomyces sp. SHP22-7]|nr:hypothetical protein D3C59_33545 [Streptomyces sp. SHP22-7]